MNGGRVVPRSIPNGKMFERFGRAGIKNLLMAYEECLRATEGIRFRKRDNFMTQRIEDPSQVLPTSFNLPYKPLEEWNLVKSSQDFS